MLFVGTHERQLDDKGRLALPAAFRAHLGEHCYLVFGDDQCVNVVPSATFEQMAEQLMARVERGEMSLQRQRAVSSSATLVTVDKQGRVSIDEKLRTYAGLATEQRVVISGNFRVIELWSPERFAQVNAAGTSDLAGQVVQ
ncbi:MAG: cell division/cell wall cluster transcriptional repressor MraZ [Actinomycetota bacterium]